ncbi:MAG: hypothetical protein ACI90V_007647, partial [Bacillariaceae sp.]
RTRTRRREDRREGYHSLEKTIIIKKLMLIFIV